MPKAAATAIGGLGLRAATFGLALLATAGVPPASAQTEPAPPGQRRTLEEIIVTAQRVEESLHDVPMSISVLNDDFLEQQSVTDFSELSQYVPNVVILPAAFSPRANMRGFGIDEISGSNKGLESPIGVTIDGVSYANKNYLQTGFFDLDRIEVLRGPQNTLFGKNNSVGLFNMVTKNPTEDYTGFVGVTIGEPERRRFEAAVGGPAIGRWLRFRIAGLSDERGGFHTNTTAAVEPAAQERMVGIDRRAVRVKAELPDVLGADVVFSYEHWDIDVRGIGLEFSEVPEGTRALFREFDPNTDFDFGDYVLSNDFPSIARYDIDTFVASARYGLGRWQLEAVLGHTTLSADNQVDADTNPAPILTAAASDSNPQTTAELRVISPELPGLFGLERLFGFALGHTEFTGGLFLQRRQVEDSRFHVAIDTALVSAFTVLGRFPPPFGLPTPPTPITRETVGHAVEETTMFWDAEWKTVAGYAQASWHFAERWTLIGGLRLGNEWREADWNRVLFGGPPVFFTAGGFEQFTASRDASEFRHAPRVNLRYDVTDDVNVFATWAQGFRSGGFNEAATRAVNLEFESETTTNWELGTNLELLDGTARANLVLFHMTITDLQLQTTDPETGFSEITNAGKARARGVELDATWLPTDWLTLRGTLGLNDAKYLEFPFGPCVLANEDSDGDGDPRCDLSGR
ncbi:MAG: TonB-dependent receptor, partial [Candidatus Binatia bacterium]